MKNIQNRQKIELYGSVTTKDLMKPRSSRQVGGAKSWRWAERQGDAMWHREEAEAVEAEWPILHSLMVDKNWEGDLGSK